MAQTTPTPMPPLPEELLQYPITFTRASEQWEGNSVTAHNSYTVTLFTALQWLLPIYILAGWLPKHLEQLISDPAPSGGNREDGTGIPHADVRLTLQLLPHFDQFFTEKSVVLPQHTELYICTESFTLPTPKGAKTITRARVEGDYRAVHQPSHAPPAGAASPASVSHTSVTNSTACFSLLPGHNQFLIHYETADKLHYANYVELDRLRFAWVAVKDLVESKVFSLQDGSITGFAKRDLKRNAPPPTADGEQSTSAAATTTAAATAISDSRRKGEAGGKALVGRGGGNARLHQGTSGNVITGPSKEALQVRKEILEKRGLRSELEEECARRWPHTPFHKSCVFASEERPLSELPLEVAQEVGLAPSNMRNRNGTARKGQMLYLGTVELPLLNKKGGTARFKATRWYTNRRDAESAAAEATLLALRSLKTNS